MKRAFGTRRVSRALRFMAETPPLHTSRKTCASYSRSECFTVFFDSSEPPHVSNHLAILGCVIFIKSTNGIFIFIPTCVILSSQKQRRKAIVSIGKNK